MACTERLTPHVLTPHRHTHSPQLPLQDLIQQLGIAFALRGFHQRAHKATEQFLALLLVGSSAILCNLFIHASQHLIDDRFEFAAVSHLLESLFLNDLVWTAFASPEWINDLLGDLA